MCISGKCEDGFCAERPVKGSSKDENDDDWRVVVLISAVLLLIIGGMCEIIINHFRQ